MLTFQNHQVELPELLEANPFIAHALLSEDIEHKRKCWSETTQIVDAETEEYDINISEHPVYRYRLNGEPSQSRYMAYLSELLDSRGMRERDLRNLCGKRLGVNPGDIHGEILKGRILWAMEKREKFLTVADKIADPEIEVYEARDPQNRYRSLTKERDIPRWWLPEKIETRATLAGLTSIVTTNTVKQVEDDFAFVNIPNSIWKPEDERGKPAEKKRRYREQIWSLLGSGYDAELRNMAGKLLVCDEPDSWYGQILRGAVIWSVNDYVNKFKENKL